MPDSKSFARFLQRFTANLKVLEIFWLNILLVILLSVCLWSLPQSMDVLVKATEAHFPGKAFLMAGLFLYVFVIWYSSRAVSWQSRLKEESNFSQWMLTHLPRLLGFYVYSIFILSYLNTPEFFNKAIHFWTLIVLLLAYFLIYLILANLLQWKDEPGKKEIALYRLLFWINIILIAICSAISNRWGLLIFAALSQLLFVFLATNRDRVFKALPASSLPGFLRSAFERAKIPEEENLLFTVFNFVASAALLIYLLLVFSLPVAIHAGTLTVVFIALTVIGGAVNLLRVLTFMFRINFGLILVVIVFAFGLFTKPHKVHLISLTDSNASPFKERQDFREFLKNWLDHHSAELEQDSIVPLIFVHSDGGASRSGYWVASVLGNLEDEAGPVFSNHLFCLSGASGGTVGNVSFFSLLYLRQQQKAPANQFRMTENAKQFLKTDFLSFTLARMLGPGMLFNCIYPFIPDRARALEYSMEEGATGPTALDHFFTTGFSKLIARKNDATYRLPLLCLNVTRMQDAHPAIVSNIIIDSTVSPARLDILNQIKPGKDIPLSAVTVLGARFPYLTPAGLIVEKVQKKGNPSAFACQYHYYVDGGYFDNSGAGIVQEMIQKIESIKKDTLQDTVFRKYHLEKLRYLIIHISNTPSRSDTLGKIHPFKNDLAAPLVTLAGTYSTQTTVNDSRLEDYFANISKDERYTSSGLNKYFNINLYTRDDKESYPMNWVISDTMIRKMDQRLKQQDTLRSLITDLNKFFMKQRK